MDNCYQISNATTSNGFRTGRSCSWRYWLLTLMMGLFFSTQSYSQTCSTLSNIYQNSDGIGTWNISEGGSGLSQGATSFTMQYFITEPGMAERELTGSTDSIYISGAYFDSTILVKMILTDNLGCIDTLNTSFVHVDPPIYPCDAMFNIYQNNDEMGTYQLSSGGSAISTGASSVTYEFFMTLTGGNEMAVTGSNDSVYISGGYEDSTIYFKMILTDDIGCKDTAYKSIVHLIPVVQNNECAASIGATQNSDGTWSLTDNTTYGAGDSAKYTDITNYKILTSAGAFIEDVACCYDAVTLDEVGASYQIQIDIESAKGCRDTAYVDVVNEAVDNNGDGSNDCHAGYWPLVDGDKNIKLATYSIDIPQNDSVTNAIYQILDDQGSVLNTSSFAIGDTISNGPFVDGNYITKVFLGTRDGCIDTFGLFVNVPAGEYGDPSGNLDPNYSGSNDPPASSGDEGCYAGFDVWQDQATANTINVNPFQHHLHNYTWQLPPIKPTETGKY